MDFKYDEIIDRKCWERIIKEGAYYGKMFNIIFPRCYSITAAMQGKAKIKVKEFAQEWVDTGQEVKITRAMFETFKQDIPDFFCYINTSPYSMDSYPDFISISMERKDFIASVWHETNHYMLRKCFPKLANIEKIKEIVSVINYSWGIKDVGWSIFKEARKKAFTVWHETKDINTVIQSIDVN